MGIDFDAVLDGLEAQAAGVPDGEASLALFRALEVPREPGAEALGRLLDACLRFLPRHPAMPDGEGRGSARHLAVCAEGVILDVLRNPRADWRALTTLDDARDRARGEAVPATAERLPGLAIPWSPEEARARIAPFLRLLERTLAKRPAAHLALSWEVLRAAAVRSRRCGAAG